MQFLADLNQKYKIANPDIIAAGRDDGLQPLFYAGKLAMLADRLVVPDPAEEQRARPASTPSHHPGGEGRDDAGDGVLARLRHDVQADEEPAEAAAEFLQWMFNKDNRLTFAKQRGVIPERIDVGADPAYAIGETEKYFVEQLKTAVSAYDSPFPANLYDNYTVAENPGRPAVMGEIPVADAMKQAAAEIDKKNGVA